MAEIYSPRVRCTSIEAQFATGSIGDSPLVFTRHSRER